MTPTDLIQRETELERKRVVALARQQWQKVLDFESRIDECKLWRKKMAEKEEKEFNVIEGTSR